MLGIVPTAVGATSILEWEPFYLPLTKPSKVYIPGCVNLLSCFLRTVYLILCQHNQCNFGGMLWYQGCNDASSVDYPTDEHAASYSSKLSDLVEYIRFFIPVLRELAACTGNGKTVWDVQ